MATYTITIEGKGLREDKARELAQNAFAGQTVGKTTIRLAGVAKVTYPSSRADRLGAAESAVSGAKDDVESLKDELQEWYDNLPENFQDGDKGQELQESIDALEALSGELDSLDWDVTFPSMY